MQLKKCFEHLSNENENTSVILLDIYYFVYTCIYIYKL